MEITASPKSAYAKNIIACVVLSITVSACFIELLRNPNDLLTGRHFGGRNDMTHAAVGYRVFPVVPIREFGQFPCWNPYSLTGIPWSSSPQSSLYYPGNWLFLLFDGIPLISWLLVAHHWLAGAGMYFLCRRYQFSWLAALFGGTAFASTPFLIAHSAEGHFPHACLIAWFPWVLLCFERLRSGQRGAVPLLACVISLSFFCGHVQEVYYLLLVLTGFLVVDIVIGIRHRRSVPAAADPGVALPQTELQVSQFCHAHESPPLRVLINWIGVGALTIGLVAIELLPVGIYTTQAVRATGISAEKAGATSFGISNLRQLVDPFALGDMQSYAGPDKFYWETVFHFGIVVLLLALTGTLFARRQYPVRRMVTLFLIGGLFACGSNTPFFIWCYNMIPGISFFRIPSRSIFFCALAMSVLAAAGVEVLLSAARRFRPDSVRFRRICHVGAVTLIAVSALELMVYSNSLFGTVSSVSFHRHNEIADFLEENAYDGRVFALQDHLSDYEAWTRGIQKVQGYDPVPLKRYGLFTAAMVQPHDPAPEMAGFETVGLKHYKKPLLDLLGVKYAIVVSIPEIPLVGWKVVKQGRIPQLVTLRGEPVKSIPYAILENENPLPRAFVIGQTRILHPADNVIDVLGQLDPRKELLLHQDLLGSGPRAELSPARIEESTPNRIRVQAELSAPGYVVLTDAWYGGWSATVDERSAPIVPADVAFRAVALDAGQHEVVFTFSPPLFKTGLVITGFTSLLVMIALAAAVYGNGDAARLKGEGDDPDHHSTT